MRQSRRFPGLQGCPRQGRERRAARSVSGVERSQSLTFRQGMTRKRNRLQVYNLQPIPFFRARSGLLFFRLEFFHLQCGEQERQQSVRVAADEGDALVVRRIGAEIGAAFHAVEIVLPAHEARQCLPGPAERLFDLLARKPSAVDAAGEAVGEDCGTGGFAGGILPVEDVAPVALRILVMQHSFDVGPVDGQYPFVIPVAAGKRVEYLARRPQGPAVAARPVRNADVGMRGVAGLPVEPRAGIEKQAVEADELDRKSVV